MKICYTNKDAVILIPDISGFTKYVATADLEHSQGKVAHLLESILDNNHLNFEVSEIEGDAILFYSLECPHSGEDIIRQCRLMFSAFHQKLNEFKTTGCRCVSCQGLNELSLKFIIHFGTLGSIMVRDYCKLFGRDLIIAHRLLKNNINSKEYILLTESFIKQFNYHNTDANINVTEVEIEDIGEISLSYVDLLGLHAVNEVR